MKAKSRAKSLLKAWSDRGLLKKSDYNTFVSGNTSKCIIWDGAKATNGYNQVRIDGKIHMPHRVMAEAQFGDIPNKKVVGHTCDKKRCVNPEHLEIITVAENGKDAWERGRYNKKDFSKKVKAGMKKAKKK